MSNDFPDQPYLERIRAALWRRGLHGHAAVMVGSGFSLNARPRSASSGSFPTWPALAKTVVENLYPSYGQSSHREIALQQAKATSGFLRLAQEYEAAFGREALERLIGEVMPDRQFEPGDLHEMLLELPWADVFTTNWDTLLERAAEQVIDRKYDVIRMVADIPASMKPRIVKLHGTLATNRPFVFTEEDFRKYPVEQAPFVNLAQQAMMENIFCLLGFSGDDPNFLYWSGWVRDHLAPYAPQIYLVGWLDLPPPRRRMLEERGVIPIDCARLPVSGSWPEELRHRYSVEWFLWSLKAGEPYRVQHWPNVRSRRNQSIPGHLSISLGGIQEPKEEAKMSRSRPGVKELREQVKVWSCNRSLYPGWLIAPAVTRMTLWWQTKSWIPEVLRLLPELADGERLVYLEEINWRLEVCLVPLPDGLPDAIDAALVAVGPMAINVTGVAASSPWNEYELRNRWLNLATALLRWAREEGDEGLFDRWFAALLPCCPIWPETRTRLRYEKCLLSLAQLDHQTVERELAEWDVDTSDTFWEVRKAGLLAEIGRTDEAFQAARVALTEIRRRTRRDVADIPSLSREGWAMVLAQGFTFYPRTKKRSRFNEPQELSRGIEEGGRSEKRWEILRIHGCDALEMLVECHRALQEDPSGKGSEEEEVLGFDPWHRTRRLYSIGPEEVYAKLLPAHQIKRLIEEVGLPSEVDHVVLSKRLLLKVAMWLAESSSYRALGLILRACTYERDDTFNAVLTRNRIALLGVRQIESLVDRVEAALAHGIRKATAALVENDNERLAYWLERLRVAIELLSRLVLRLSGERAESVLKNAIDYCGERLFQNSHPLIGPLANLFYRTLQVLEPNRIQKHLPRFFDLPIPGEKGFEPADYDRWPEPLSIIEHLKLSEPVIAPEPSVVQKLIELVRLSPSTIPRKYAVKRILVMLDWSLLTEEEQGAFGEALWRHRAHDGFPAETGLYEALFLSLPQPQSHLAERVFRNKYLNSSSVAARHISERYLRNMAIAAKVKTDGHGDFQLSATEIEQVVEGLVEWWRRGGIAEASNAKTWPSSFDRENFEDALVDALCQAVLPHLTIDSPYVTNVASIVEDLRAASFPVAQVYPILVRLQPERLPEIADHLRESLDSKDSRIAQAAVEAVWWWLQNGRDFGTPEPPIDLIREIALAVSLRRSSCLKGALSAAEWILLHARDDAGQRFIDLIAEGLRYLLEEARYDVQPRKAADAGFAAEETSFIRSLCVKVAVAASRTEQESRPVFQEWIQQAQEDPLPEVRLALREAESGLG